MEQLELLPILKDNIKEIWKNFYENAKEFYSPLAPKYVKTNKILFLSLNPSICKDAPKNCYELETYDDYSHSHYKKFHEIVETIGLSKDDWTFLDLLYVREMQNEIQRIEKENKSNFIVDQVKLTVQIIKKVRPRLVIVCNSFASKILHRYNYEVDFEPILENGVYHLDKIPFIIEQSKFLGNPRYKHIFSTQNKNKKTEKKKELLINEIKKILLKTENWEKNI